MSKYKKIDTKCFFLILNNLSLHYSVNFIKKYLVDVYHLSFFDIKRHIHETKIVEILKEVSVF